MKEYKTDAIKTPIFVAFEVIFDVLIPYLMSLLVDQGINQHDMNKVWMYGGLMLLCAFLALWAGAKSGKYAAIASAGFAKTCAKPNSETFKISRFPILTNIRRAD